MTLPLERARSRKPVTWLTLVGVLLLPVVIGGILITALYNPTERLDAMTVAVVNDDEPVTVGGQMAPLGRQLTAGLVEGSDDIPSNLTWTISNTDDAAEGLADGTYNAVVTIPQNFSAAATSTAPGSTPEKATIQVETAPDAHIVDDAITAQVTQAAASLMGQQLSEVYLENVLLGFTTIGDQLGEAADGAHQLADGAAQAADGAAQLPDGASALSSGAAQLGDGAGQIADGIGGLGSGATQLAGGLGTIAQKTREAGAGASQLAAGVSGGAAQLRATGLVPAKLSDGAATAATATKAYIAGLGQLASGCAASGAAPAFCAQLTAAVDPTAMQGAGGVIAATQGVSDGLTTFDREATAQIAGQFDTIATNIGTLAGGLDQLAGGVDQSTAGATALASGAGQLQTGADGLASGATQLADGATQLADGATQLSDGVGELATGTNTLADGLTTAVDQIPTYSDAEATDLATVVANPVTAEGVGTNLFGASAIPLLAMLALWFGGLASFVALQAVPRGALSSRRPSVLLALRAFLPAAGIGALQGALVAGIVQLAASYDAGTWWAFAGLSVVAGVVFAAVNQALVAVFGGAGRWISALVGVLAVATGIVSTVPGVLTSIAALMPTSPAYTAMLAALTPATGVAASLTGMIVWGALAFLVSVLAVARRRATTASAVLKASPALA